MTNQKSCSTLCRNNLMTNAAQAGLNLASADPAPVAACQILCTPEVSSWKQPSGLSGSEPERNQSDPDRKHNSHSKTLFRHLKVG